MRPALKSGLLPLWRDRDTLQIGVDPRRAIALSGMGQLAFLIGLLDGSRDRDQVVAAAARQGVPPRVTERVLTVLAAGGALDDFPASTLRALPAPLRTRLSAELATASLAYRDSDGGARFLARRRTAVVVIEGDRHIGRGIARILRAAGVTGIRPELSRSGRADLVILVGRPPRALPDRLVRERTAHLAVSAGEAIGVVGPLVVPGQTACLRCLDHARAASDPAWPLILAQLDARRPDPPACDAVLTAAVAAQAAAQALIAIDTSPANSGAAGGTLELVLPDWRWRRRVWAPHPACTCGTVRTGPRPGTISVLASARRAAIRNAKSQRPLPPARTPAPRDAAARSGSAMCQPRRSVTDNRDHERSAAPRRNQDGEASDPARRTGGQDRSRLR